MVTIINQALEIKISPIGAELQSIKDKEGIEYLWQGNSQYWAGRATNLFPFVGRLPGGKYTYGGKEYEMTSHGFCRGNEFSVISHSTESVEFFIESNDAFRAIYPFEFRFSIIYTLVNDRLEITYKVINTDSKEIYFGLGAHPGFNVPIANEGEFTDYYLEFNEKSNPNRVLTSETCFISGEESVYPLENQDTISLSHDLFDDDAIILKGMPSVIRIKNKIGAPEIELSYPQMTYLVLWHTVKKDAPFICVEPWESLPGRDVEIEDLQTHPYMTVLESDKVYENKWSISILK